MQNKTLKIFYPVNPPSVMPDCPIFPPLHVTKSCHFPGLMVEILNLLAQESDLKIEAYKAEDFGINPDKLKDVASFGLLDLILNGTVDLIAMSFQETEHRKEAFSFTEMVYQTQTRVMKRPETKKFAKMWVFFDNYDKYTWLAFIFVWILQWLLGVLVQRVEAAACRRKPPPFLESTWKILRMLLRQPESLHCCSLGGKFSMFLFAFIQCTVLLGLYSSLILANIIKSNVLVTENVGTVLSQLQSGEYYMVTDAPSKWIFEFINNSLAYPYPEFKYALTKNPFRITNDVDETLNEVLNNKALVFVQDDDKVNYYSRANCQLEAIREGMPLADVKLMLRKDSPFVSILNRAIGRNRLLLNVIEEKYTERLRMRRLCYKDSSYQALTVAPYAGVGCVCMIILLIAFLLLLIEKLSSAYYQKTYYY